MFASALQSAFTFRTSYFADFSGTSAKITPRLYGQILIAIKIDCYGPEPRSESPSISLLRTETALSFWRSALPPSPGESGGHYVIHNAEKMRTPTPPAPVDAGAIMKSMTIEQIAQLTETLCEFLRENRAPVSSRRLFDREAAKTSIDEYRFSNQDTSPLDCAASHCSTALLVETVRRQPRGDTLYPPTNFKRWPTFIRRLRPEAVPSGGPRLDTPKRRRQTHQNQRDLDKIDAFPVLAPSAAAHHRDAAPTAGSAPPPSSSALSPVDTRMPPIVLRDKSRWFAPVLQ